MHQTRLNHHIQFVFYTWFWKFANLKLWKLFLFGKITQKPWCNLKKYFKKIAPWFLPDFSRNQRPPWLGSVSFETWHIKVRFEYWTIFEGYLRAEIFEKQIWTFGQSLIFNVNLRKFRKSEIKTNWNYENFMMRSGKLVHYYQMD